MYGESEEDYKKRKEQKILGTTPDLIVVDDVFIPTSGVHNPLTLLTHFRIEAELAYIQSKKELGENHPNTLKLNDILNQFEKFADGCSTINPSFDIVLAYMKEEG